MRDFQSLKRDSPRQCGVLGLAPGDPNFSSPSTPQIGEEKKVQGENPEPPGTRRPSLGLPSPPPQCSCGRPGSGACAPRWGSGRPGGARGPSAAQRGRAAAVLKRARKLIWAGAQAVTRREGARAGGRREGGRAGPGAAAVHASPASTGSARRDGRPGAAPPAGDPADPPLGAPPPQPGLRRDSGTESHSRGRRVARRSVGALREPAGFRSGSHGRRAASGRARLRPRSGDHER